MIIFRQKEYSATKIHNFKEFFEARNGVYFSNGPLNMMKAIEMLTFDDGKYIDHWINDMVGDWTIHHIRNKIPKFTPQTAFIGTDPNVDNIGEILGMTIQDKYEALFVDSDGFINYVIDRMLYESHRGDSDKEPKYERWFSKNPITSQKRSAMLKEYPYIFRYISLCLSGQLDPDVDLYDSSTKSKLFKMNVDYKREDPRLKRSETLINERLFKCFKNICYI